MSFVTGPDGALSRKTAFEQLVAQYQTALLRMCCLYLRDKTLAEDAVQETFIKAWRGMDRFRGDSSEKTWLMRIAINTCRDMNRSGWLRFMERRFTPEDLPEPVAPIAEKEEELVKAIMQLPLRLREVTLLYYYQGMTTQEAAESLGIAQASVSGRLKRAREKLRIYLEEGE